MNAQDLPQYHEATVWVTSDGKKKAMRLYSRPPHDPFLANPEKGDPEELLPPHILVLTKAQIESLTVQKPGFLESDIVITHQPAKRCAQEDVC